MIRTSHMLWAILLLALTPAHAEAPVDERDRPAEQAASLAEQAAYKWVKEYNRRYPEWVHAVHAEGVVWVELPVAGIYPGFTGTRSDLQNFAKSTLATFPDRQFRLISVIANGRRAALELEWTGTAVKATPHVKPGDKITLRQATFIDVDETGKVVRQVDHTIRM